MISLNSQWGDIYNFYLLLNDNDHQDEDQWIWLQNQLESAKSIFFFFFFLLGNFLAAAGEKVIIIGHIPPGESPPALYVSWGDTYVNMSAKYADVIVGHFYGHTHSDEVRKFFFFSSDFFFFPFSSR